MYWVCGSNLINARKFHSKAHWKLNIREKTINYGDIQKKTALRLTRYQRRYCSCLAHMSVTALYVAQNTNTLGSTGWQPDKDHQNFNKISKMTS